MAYAESVYPASGVGPYDISFSYDNIADIKVDHLGVGLVPFTFHGTPSEHQPGGTEVLLGTAVSSGTIRVFKDTSLTTPTVEWNKSAALTEANLDTMQHNLLDMIHVVADKAEHAGADAESALEAVDTLADSIDTTLSDFSDQMTTAVDAAQSARDLAEFWAQIALDAGSTANPEEAAAVARDAAIAAQFLAEAARDAAIVARNAAQAAQALTEAARDSAQASATSAATSELLAEQYATADQGTEVEPGKYSAKHYAETAQDIVDAGALRWSGSLKFVSTTDPNPALGTDGDIWIKRAP